MRPKFYQNHLICKVPRPQTFPPVADRTHPRRLSGKGRCFLGIETKFIHFIFSGIFLCFSGIETKFIHFIFFRYILYFSPNFKRYFSVFFILNFIKKRKKSSLKASMVFFSSIKKLFPSRFGFRNKKY